MLRRDMNVRAGVQKLLDSALLVVSLLLAHRLRFTEAWQNLLGVPPIAPLEQYSWICVLLAFFGPIVLDSQGFYRRPLLTGRRDMLWPLLKGCIINSILIVLVLYFFKHQLARSIGP